MSIFTPKAAVGTPETPESLATILTEAQLNRDAAVREAQLVLDAEKAYVLERAETRSRAITDLVDELVDEREALAAAIEGAA